MTASTQDKINAYKAEARALAMGLFKGKDWAEVGPKFDDMFARIDQEPEEVKRGLAEVAVNSMDEAIKLVVKTPKLVFNMFKGKAESKIPRNMKQSKRNIAQVEGYYTGPNMPPRVAFYFAAIKNLPDYDDGNPKAVVQGIRDAYNRFKR